MTLFKERRFPYEIRIRQEITGCFIVQVGCVTLPIKDENEVLYALSKYFKDPERTVEEYHNTNSKHQSERNLEPVCDLTMPDRRHEPIQGREGRGGFRHA